jgi:hypothetical protein
MPMPELVPEEIRFNGSTNELINVPLDQLKKAIANDPIAMEFARKKATEIKVQQILLEKKRKRETKPPRQKSHNRVPRKHQRR